MQPLPAFTCVNPPRILFGWGRLSELPAEAARLGRAPLVVTGGSFRLSGRLDAVLAALRDAGLEPRAHVCASGEPDLDALQHCMDAAATSDLVIGIGGGSVLDVAKAAAALGGTGASAADYFAGRPLPASGRPIVAAPTTSGTGSEATWVTVLTDHNRRRKASIRGDALMPNVALVDPELTVTCPTHVTAHSGLDAFVQAVEAYTSAGANPLTDALALEAAALAGRSLERAVADGADRPAREAMALGSLLAGMALNTSRLGLVHGLAHPLGALTGAAHGMLCGMLMPAVIEFNRDVAAARYARVAVALGLAEPSLPQQQATDRLKAFVAGMLDRLGFPAGLTSLGVTGADLEWLAKETMPSGSTQANPRPVSPADARAVAASLL